MAKVTVAELAIAVAAMQGQLKALRSENEDLRAERDALLVEQRPSRQALRAAPNNTWVDRAGNTYERQVTYLGQRCVTRNVRVG